MIKKLKKYYNFVDIFEGKYEIYTDTSYLGIYVVIEDSEIKLSEYDSEIEYTLLSVKLNNNKVYLISSYI